MYEPEEGVPEEPTVCFVPLGAGDFEGDALEQSMLLLGDGLASGAALKQVLSFQHANSVCSTRKMTVDYFIIFILDLVKKVN